MISFDESYLNQFEVDDKLIYKKAKNTLSQGLCKPTDGPISKYLNRPLSIKISSFLVKFHIEPNHLTLFSFVLSVLAAVSFYMGQYVWIVIGGILVQLSSIFDGCDGEIARLKYKQSRFGAWLDRVLDRYADGLIFVGITHAVFVATPNQWVLLAGFGAIMGAFMNSYTALEFDKILKEDLLIGLKHFRFGRDLRLFIIFVGAVFNQLLLTLIILSVLSNIESIRRLFVFRNAHRLSQKNRKSNRTSYSAVRRSGRLSPRPEY